MSPEWLTAAGTMGTFVVIAATAVVALIQLRHVRNSNQIVVLGDVRHRLEASDFQDAFDFIRFELPGMIGDPAARKPLLNRNSPEFRKIALVANYLDYICNFVKHGVVDRDLACDLWYGYIVRSWDMLAPVTATWRAMLGYMLWEDFEYLALLCKRFRDKYPAGTYPENESRLQLPDPWDEAKAQSPA